VLNFARQIRENHFRVAAKIPTISGGTIHREASGCRYRDDGDGIESALALGYGFKK